MVVVGSPRAGGDPRQRADGGGPPAARSYAVLFVFGWLRDTLALVVSWGGAAGGGTGGGKGGGTGGGKGYAPLVSDFENFYIRNLYGRIEDCFNRPIASAPGRHIDVCVREWRGHGEARGLQRTGGTVRALNLSSYNYLGFAAQDAYCTPRCLDALRRYGWSTSSPSKEAGQTQLHAEAEELVAEYMGQEAAMIFGMGFATNTATLPVLCGRGDLIVSDALNHKSIVAGAKLAGAKVKVFKHNDPRHLEKVLRLAIAEGQPRKNRPWRKIYIVVEGIYSMEGDIAPLREIVALKKKYKAYLYLDEAHSVGAMGATGRGLCEHFGVDPRDVDILMGTFTKSFGSCGGYIASTREVIQFLKKESPSTNYATSMAPPAVAQVIASLQVVMGRDGSQRGQEKIRQLKDNSNYFRKKLKAMGLEVLGDEDSPIMPIMIYHPNKLPAVGRQTLEQGVAVVVVGFPATPLLLARARICISACHTREDLDHALEVLKDVDRKAMLSSAGAA